MLAAYPETIRLLCTDVSGKRWPGYAPSKKFWARRENRRAKSDLAVEHDEGPGETGNALPGFPNATKNVAFCLTDVNRTTGLVCLKYGGEGGIRTHGRVSPTLAFEASSFNRSDTSPQRQSHSSGGATAGQRQLVWRFRSACPPKLLLPCRAPAKRQEGRDTPAIGFVAGPESSC
jgi:hypothetical protein